MVSHAWQREPSGNTGTDAKFCAIICTQICLRKSYICNPPKKSRCIWNGSNQNWEWIEFGKKYNFQFLHHLKSTYNLFFLLQFKSPLPPPPLKNVLYASVLPLLLNSVLSLCQYLYSLQVDIKKLLIYWAVKMKYVRDITKEKWLKRP